MKDLDSFRWFCSGILVGEDGMVQFLSQGLFQCGYWIYQDIVVKNGFEETFDVNIFSWLHDFI